MFNFSKKREKPAKGDPETPPQESPKSLEEGLSKTRSNFSTRMRGLFQLKKRIDDDLLDEIETTLLTADVGVAASQAIVDELTSGVKRRQLADSDALFAALKKQLTDLLRPCEQKLIIDPERKPYVILVVGVNGAGKTTTIGKLAKRFKQSGLDVMLAAGDTFRAAAVEQLQRWGERNQVPVVAQSTGADSASVVYDALESARARGADLLIADTAGRLHTQGNLMEELKKIRRVLGKLDADAPHEVLLVLDGGTGQNAIAQAQQFHAAVGVTGLAVTKLDGTAKGGVLFALAKELELPVRYIGIGESADDLREFNATEFANTLLH